MSKIKVWLNMAVNALSFLGFLSLMSTGLILHYTLPPGSGHRAAGMRHGAGGAVRTFLGMNRHEWGDVHFIIAIIFMSLLAVHLVFHWKWLYCTAWGSRVNPQSLRRRLITLAILTYIVIAFVLPFVNK